MALGYVRAAREDEAAQIARIQVATWRTAFTRIVPGPVLDGLDERVLATHWAAAVAHPPSPRHHVLVAVEEAATSNIAGFAAIGPADETALAPEEQPDNLPEHTGAVTELLVEPRWGRRGHGSRLLAAAVDTWRADGHVRALAWLFERDGPGHGLLEGAGWEPDGAVRALDMEGTLVRQERLHVALTD